MERIVVDRIASGFIDALRDNLTRSRGGEDDSPLASLVVWDKVKFRSYEDGRRRVKGDRGNSDVPLVDTGRLLKSIAVGGVKAFPITSDGRRGRCYEITLHAAEHGNQFTETRTFSDVLLGRTKAIRASRNFGDLREGYDYVVRDQLTVPGRPWNRISRTRTEDIAQAAVRIAAGV